MKNIKKLKYIDIFSWCWWLSLWLYNSWLWEWLFAIEKNKDAFSTLEYNLISKKNHFSFPEWLEQKQHDINEVLENENLKELVWKVDLVAGWPPCQGFSLAGKRNINDIRNSLVHSYIKFIEIVKPKVIFFENVKWFCAPFKDKKWDNCIAFSNIVIEELKRIWYDDAAYEILDFSLFWVPQSRKRFIIVATLKGNAKDFFSFIKQNKNSFLQNKWVPLFNTLESAISDLQKKKWTINSIDTNWFMDWKYWKIENDYQKYMRLDSTIKIPDSHRFPNHKKETENKFKIAIKEQLTSNQIREKFNTKKSSTRVLKKDSPSPTLTTLPDDLIHYSEPRILTVREYARIQSFPDNYEFKWKYTTGWPKRKEEVPRYTQIWNAIPPLFAEQAGIALYNLLK